MTIVTVFRSRLQPGVDHAYGEVADEMRRLVCAMDGFIDESFYMSSDGERVTIVRFRDRETQRAWAELPEHVAAQRRGRDEFYSWYDISVSEETYQRTFEVSADQQDRREKLEIAEFGESLRLEE